MKKFCAFVDRIFYPFEGNLFFIMLVISFISMAMFNPIIGGVSAFACMTGIVLLRKLEIIESSQKEAA